MKLFEYAILMHPTKEEEKKGKKTYLLKPITSVLSDNKDAVVMLAAREIEEEHMNKLDRIEVAIRPF